MPTSRLPLHQVPLGVVAGIGVCPPNAQCATPIPLVTSGPTAPTSATGISQVFFPTMPVPLTSSPAPSDPLSLLPYRSFSANDWLALVQSGAFGYAS